MSSYKIVPKAEVGSIALSSHYIKSNGAHVYLDQDRRTIKEGTPAKDVRPFKRLVSRLDPLTVQYTPGLPEDERVLQFWKDHSTITCNGYVNPNFKTSQFVLEIESELIHEANKVIQQKGIIFNQLNSMGVEDLKDTAFLMGEFNPAKMGRDEIFAKLVGIRFDGPALTKKHMTPNGEVLLFNDFRNRQADEKEMLVIIMKAIHWGILKNEGGQFMSGTTSLGANPEEIMLTCRANPDMYRNNVRAKVVRADENANPSPSVPRYVQELPMQAQAPSFSEVATEELKQEKPNAAANWRAKSKPKKEIPLPPNVKMGKWDLTSEEMLNGWREKSIGFGKFKKYLVGIQEDK